MSLDTHCQSLAG